MVKQEVRDRIDKWLKSKGFESFPEMELGLLFERFEENDDPDERIKTLGEIYLIYNGYKF